VDKVKYGILIRKACEENVTMAALVGDLTRFTTRLLLNLIGTRMFRHFGTKLFFPRNEDHDPTKQCSSLIVNLSLTLSWSKKLLEIDRRKTRQTDTSLKHLWTITATFSSQEGNMLQLNYWAYIPAWGELSRTRTCHCFSSELRDSVFKLCIWLHFNFNGTPPKSVING